MTAMITKNRLEASKLAMKSASMGTSPDIPYEQAFANIAHEFLRSRVPTLLDSEVGFQLVDKSKNGEKALGAFGFKVGDRSLIIPVVYYDGEVKGHEVIYVVDQNICVPSTEAWVSYLTQKQPDQVGEQVINNRQALGIRNPPLSLLTRSPLKFASEQAKKIASRYAEWCHPFLAWFSKIATATLDDQMGWAPGIGEQLAGRPLKDQEAFLMLLKDYPALKVAAEKLNHGLNEELEKTIDASINKHNLPGIFGSVLGDPKPKEKALKVLYYAEASKAVVPYDLSDSDKEKLVNKGYVVQDKRKDNQKPTAHIIHQETLNLLNPTNNMIADVFVRPGKFERCLVLANVQNPDRPEKNNTHVIRLSDKKFTTVDRNAVFLDDDAEDIEEITSFLKKLPAVGEASLKKDSDDMDPGYVLLRRGRGGLEASCLFNVIRSLGKQGEDEIYEIEVRHNWCDSSSSIGAGIDPRDKMRNGHRGYEKSRTQLRISKDGESIRKWQDELVVPVDAKVLRLGEASYSFDRKNILAPADLRDVSAVIWKGLSRLDIHRGHSEGREFTINLDKPVTKDAAVLKLVESYELPEDVACSLLDQVEVGKKQTFGVKKADAPPWLIDEGRSEAPDFPWNQNTGGNWIANPNVDNDSSMNYQLPVPGLVASQNDPTNWDPRVEPDVPYMNQAMQAAQKGQRDVFNTKAVLSIVNKDQSGDMGPIIKCMDALGRRYLAFCWQREAMNDQYGSADASDIEDSLLENFEGLGEMTIAMYERDIRNGDHAELLKAKLTVHSEDTGEDA